MRCPLAASQVTIGQIRRAKAWILPISLWSVGPIIGLLVAHFSQFGASADDQVFEICALIEPLFGLAVFVELVLVLGRVVEAQGATNANRHMAHAVLRTNAGLLCISEGLALYAVAARCTSTLLIIAVLLPMLTQLYLLVDCAYNRVGLSWIQKG